MFSSCHGRLQEGRLSGGVTTLEFPPPERLACSISFEKADEDGAHSVSF